MLHVHASVCLRHLCANCQDLQVTENSHLPTGARRGRVVPQEARGRHRSPQPPLSLDNPRCHHRLSLHSHHPGCCPHLGRTGQVLVLWKVTATTTIFLQPPTHRSLFPMVEGTGLPCAPGRGPVTHRTARCEGHGCKVKMLLPTEQLWSHLCAHESQDKSS